MTAAYLVVYEGRPHQPDEWLRYYLEEHLPLVWRFPGIRGIDVHVGRDESDFFLITRLLFDDLETLRRAVGSMERLAARRDMEENILPRFGGRVRHQTTEVRSFSEPSSSPNRGGAGEGGG